MLSGNNNIQSPIDLIRAMSQIENNTSGVEIEKNTPSKIMIQLFQSPQFIQTLERRHVVNSDEPYKAVKTPQSSYSKPYESPLSTDDSWKSPMTVMFFSRTVQHKPL
jgi:hypothetical protein